MTQMDLIAALHEAHDEIRRLRGILSDGRRDQEPEPDNKPDTSPPAVRHEFHDDTRFWANPI